MQFGVEVRLDELDVAQELPDTFECVVLALDGYENFLRRDERVDREQTERRRQSMIT